MNKTKIEWVKNPDGTQGYTWNPITGCLNHVNGMCKGGGFPCYAYKLAYGRLKPLYLKAHALPKDKGILADSYPTTDPFYPRFWEGRLRELSKRKQQLMDGEPKPMGVFVCDMGDLFGIGVPKEWTTQIMDAIWDNDEYDRFYLLTKQPQNLIKFSPFSENCWVGVTGTGFEMSQRAISHLKRIKAKVKFISYEPLLEKVTLYPLEKGAIDWIIIGAQTKPYKPPEIEWAREIVEAADKAGIPVFLKDNLKPIVNDIDLFINPTAVYPYGVLRQELPVVNKRTNRKEVN